MSSALSDLPSILDILAEVNERPCSVCGETGDTLPCLICDVLICGECGVDVRFCRKCKPMDSTTPVSQSEWEWLESAEAMEKNNNGPN